MQVSNCTFCNRRKQTSKRWKEPRCVCCDVHEGNCKHRPKTDPVDIFKTHLWPLTDPFTKEVTRMTLGENNRLWAEFDATN